MIMQSFPLGTIVAALTLAISTTVAQNITAPAECTSGSYPGKSVAIVTLPYTYDQVISIIGSYKNLTWSGNPDSTVSLNGPDNTVGTTRTYDILGAHIVEKLLNYSKPPAPGPYNEIHSTALFDIPSANVSGYIPYDGTVVTSICDGRATVFNFTAIYCASNATLFGSVLDQVHTKDGVTVGQFLGGMNFTSCEALGGAPSPNATVTGTAPIATFTGGAAGVVDLRLKGGYGFVTGLFCVVVPLLASILV